MRTTSKRGIRSKSKKGKEQPKERVSQIFSPLLFF